MELFPAFSNEIDLVPVWTWILFAARFSGIFFSLPGVGTEAVNPRVRGSMSLMLALALTMSGVRADMPADLISAMLLVGSEVLLGFALGLIPSILIGGLSVAGQVVSGSIGLGQANMIDKSLGGNVSVLSNIQVKIATIIFLAIDGHHAVIRAAAGGLGNLKLGQFRPDMHTAMILVNRFSTSFDLALTVAAPILVTTLLTQFVLGLITKFVPTVNIFIISLPLGVVVGLYITAYTYPGFTLRILEEFATLQEFLGQVLTSVG